MILPRLFSRALLATGLLSLLVVAGCRHDTDAVPTFGGPELYPLSVGTYRIYAVQDTTWRLNVPTIGIYQQREIVTDSFPGPARTLGQPSISYRVVRARRADAAQTWVEDSVFVLTPLPQSLLLNNANRRTIELLFPVRAGRVWNRLAFDAQDSLSREYRRPGEAVTLALPGGQTKTYDQSVRVIDVDAEDVLYHRTYEQIYAPGVGPVQRRRRNLGTYTLNPATGEQLPSATYIYEGSAHREVLLEAGKIK